MNRQQEILHKVRLFGLIGIGLFGIAVFAPDATPHHGPFFQPALQTSWSNVLDFPAMWASVKIILFCIGLFLMIETTGTVLSVFKFRSLALLVFFLQAVPCLGLLCGGYYLVKSLL